MCLTIAGSGSVTDLYFTGFVPFGGHSPFVLVESTGLLDASGTQIVVVSANALSPTVKNTTASAIPARPRFIDASIHSCLPKAGQSGRCYAPGSPFVLPLREAERGNSPPNRW